MTEFSVWAPSRSRMSVLVDGKDTRMEKARDGWWTAVVDAPDSCDYMFLLDEKQLLPDPRSQFQPEGVHGPSRMVDLTSFEWSDCGFRAAPLSSAIIYELHIGTFTPQGTLDATCERLSHLVDLGITHVELMPVAEFAGTRGWGYDGVYPYAVHHLYGGPRALQRFVDACHSAGLAVILDVVYNHFGPSGNYLPQFGPYFTDRHKTPWGSAINFDGPKSDEVRRYFIESAKMWLRDFHIDGLRLDAIHAIVDTSAYPFLEQLVVEVKQLEAHLRRPLAVIAESDLNDPRIIRSREAGGFELDAQWSDDFHHAIHVLLCREQHGYYCDYSGVADLANVFRQPYLYSGRYSPFRQRSHGRWMDSLNGWKFLAYSQNHDQVGNRATGDRLHQIAGLDRAKVAAALVLLSPYIPMLFQGEEWASSSPFQYFVDFADDPDLARAVSEGRRHEFRGLHEGFEVPDPQSEDTFFRSKLNWDELQAPQHVTMLAWYRELISLRRQYPELSDGDLANVEVSFDEGDDWLTIHRGRIQLVVNLAEDHVVVELEPSATIQLLLASSGSVRLERATVELPPSSVVILHVEPTRTEISPPIDRSLPSQVVHRSARTSEMHK